MTDEPVEPPVLDVKGKGKVGGSEVAASGDSTEAASGGGVIESKASDAVEEKMEVVKGEEIDDFDGLDEPLVTGAGKGAMKSVACPYLDSIARSRLDFDLDKVCSQTLDPLGVHMCLVCGVYLRGRGQGSPAYTHAVKEDHHVFMDLSTTATWCLPDGYQVTDPGLEDLVAAANPKFAPTAIEAMDQEGSAFSGPVRVLDGSYYLPGAVGLNNVHQNDFINVVVQVLAHIEPIRNHFLGDAPSASTMPTIASSVTGPPVVLEARVGEVIRKMWSRSLFRPAVSPQQVLTAVAAAAKGRWDSESSIRDPIDFLAWMLRTLEQAKGKFAGVMRDALKGQVKIWTQHHGAGKEEQMTEAVGPFQFLTLDLPLRPLFKDETEDKLLIPRVPIYELLDKFNGEFVTEDTKRLASRKYKLQSLPKVLIFCIRRFTRNTQGVTEKNPTIVNFPLEGLNMGAYADVPEGTPTLYRLVASVTHDGSADKGLYHIHLLHKSTKAWYDVRDLTVESVMPQLVAQSESLMLVYERS